MNAEGADLLELRAVRKGYSTGANTVEVLRGIDLTLKERESLAVVGPSGSGKSTLLNIIGGLDSPSAGQVRLAGQELSGLDAAELAAVRNRRLGFIFQSHYLLPQCTVVENVLVPTLAETARDIRSGAADRARHWLERVGLDHRLHHRPGQLSGGERQRVAVVRALINQPALLLADEPTGALDRATAENLADLLVELNQKEGIAMIVVTHALGLARRMGRVCELRDGTLTGDTA